MIGISIDAASCMYGAASSSVYGDVLGTRPARYRSVINSRQDSKKYQFKGNYAKGFAFVGVLCDVHVHTCIGLRAVTMGAVSKRYSMIYVHRLCDTTET